ncbi:carboxypeptidase C (cathepsin A) [Actinokineospora baliensis]|uniref:S10 family peptidase n=1 Tax=Actinokineospora baliensis TaxID=547056 RepID=UPI00195E3A13|nr:peptidase S10 [Actinokineospora baliensis]MBM7771848.1 carboxypeptidase C (cathepsin A) [Actinokineospora baliensis]
MASTDSDSGAKPEVEPTDDLVSTAHSLTVRRRKLNYTATTGRVVLRKEVSTEGAFDGHLPKAEVFLTAYTLDGADPARRPVTFAFNGGPGSASVWLHLGLFGPRRVVTGDAGEPAAPPFTLVDNTETLLAHSDLVFIDPVSTGYSRAVKGEKAGEFHGFQADLESVGEVIRLWTSRNGRWISPKFLAGESYGTTRAAGLAHHLQSRHGMYLNGLVLISSVLDFATMDFTTGNDAPYALFLPSYAAIAHYHGLHGDRPLREVLDEAEAFATRDYPYALAMGSRLSTQERETTAATLARLTGLSADYVERVNLRVEHVRFFTELLRHRKQTTGRLDGRFTGWEADYGRERFSEDPAAAAIMGAYTAGINHYLHTELAYPNDLPYEVLSLEVNRSWSFKEFENAHVTVADRLAAAMRTNPHLRVHVASGYHDGATPYFATEHSLAQLNIPDELRANIEVSYYEAGHMMYVHEPSRLRQSKDIAAFIGKTVSG